MINGMGGVGLSGSVHTALTRAPVFWWDTRDWVGRTFSSYPQPWDSHDGALANRGTAGRDYDIPVIVEHDAFGYDLYAELDRWNWPQPNLVTVGYTDPRNDNDYPFRNFNMETLVTDMGGPPSAGGPYCFQVLVGDLVSNGVSDIFQVEPEAHVYGFDDHQSITHYYGDCNGGEMFIEWFDETTGGFNETRGPNNSWTGFDILDLAGRLLTIWQDSDTGIGDIWIDDHSLWDDITWNGTYSGLTDGRAEAFYRAYGFGDIEPGNNPDAYIADTYEPIEILFELLEADQLSSLPIGTWWPTIRCVAFWRGAPTVDEIRAIKAAMEDSLGTYPFGYSPSNQKPWGYFDRNYDGDNTTSHTDSYTVPAGVTEVRIHCRPSAGGYSYKSRGLYFELPVSPGDTITVELGGAGGMPGNRSTFSFDGKGGWPDGGDAGFSAVTGFPTFWSAGGGGSTRIYLNGTLVAIIGGAGGGLASTALAGGNSGFPTLTSGTWAGENGRIGSLTNQPEGGKGATNSTPGAAGASAGHTVAATAGDGSGNGGDGASTTSPTVMGGGGGGGGGKNGGGGGGMRLTGATRTPAGGGAGSHWFHAMVSAISPNSFNTPTYSQQWAHGAVAIQPL